MYRYLRRKWYLVQSQVKAVINQVKMSGNPKQSSLVQDPPKYYSINNEQMINPAFIHKQVPSRYLDSWPAHSSGRLYPYSQILVTNNHHIKVFDEHESKLPNLVPKPKFLEFLESYVKNELINSKVTEVKPDPRRLQIHCEAFEWLIQALKSYRPLLSSIKREYEMNIDYFRSELRRVEPMKELLWTLSHEYDQRLMAIRKKESKEITELRNVKNKLSMEVGNLTSELETLKCELKRLVEELESQNLLCRNEADARKILINDLNDLRSKLKEMERLAKATDLEEQKEDPVKLRWGYEQSKIKLASANQKIVTLEALYADVVPKNQFDLVDDKFQKVSAEAQKLREENEALSTAFNNLQSQYNAIYIQRDHLYLQLKNTRQKLLSSSPMSKAERMQLEKSDTRLQQIKDNLEEEANKWIQLANELTHEELISRIQEELSKTDGSAEIAVEVFMNASFQEILGQKAAGKTENDSFIQNN